MSRKRQNESRSLTKASTSHGVYSWLRTGRVNPSIQGYRKLQKYLEDLERDLVKDLGGADHLTAAREILVKQVVEAHGAFLLASMHLKSAGLLRPDKASKGIVELQPILAKSYLSFMNTSRLHLQALGLDRREPPQPSLADIYRQIDEEAEAAEAAKRGGGLRRENGHPGFGRQGSGAADDSEKSGG